jgi:hypothetical protein
MVGTSIAAGPLNRNTRQQGLLAREDGGHYQQSKCNGCDEPFHNRLQSFRVQEVENRSLLPEGSRIFSVVYPERSLQDLLFPPAIFRALLQEVRRPLRRT